jgi:hypothetical protein
MTIDSDTNQGGALRRAVSRAHENDRNPSVYSYFEKKRKNTKINKKLLAMAINPDTNEGRASRGSMSRNYEGVGDLSLYCSFERFFRPALRSHGLLFRRVGGKCAGFA